MNSNLPDYINATQTFTYDVEAVREYLRECDIRPTDDAVIQTIETWAAEEFGWGDYILIGPDGEEIA
jgi:hypothetical protein